jgi:rare lipoprotein A
MIVVKKLCILVSIAILVACGGSPTIKPTTPHTSSTSAKSQTTKKSGGYYLDDGPGENAPANIDSIPSATLKTEQPSKRANKPYMALGQQYTPMTAYSPYKKEGVASWYGKRYHGKQTSTGEIYDMYAMSAAHTILPIPSYAKVTNPANGRSVIVRINDRGPFKNDRLIDLSYAAAYQLRITQQGSGLVVVEAIDTSAEAMKSMANNKTAQTNVAPINAAPENSIAATQAASASTTKTVATETTSTKMVTSNPTAIPASTAGSSIITSYYVQAGAFKNEGNGDLLQKKIQALDLAENVGVANVYNGGLYRVKLGPYASKNEADASATTIRKQLNITTYVTNQ